MLLKMKEKKLVEEEIEIPKGIEAKIEGGNLELKGPKGAVTKRLANPFVGLEAKGNMIVVKARRATKREKKIAGSFVAHIKNMIKGVSEKHRYTLKICAGHFPISVSVEGKKFVIKNFLGEKIPRVIKIKEGADVKVEGDHVLVESADKELAGQTAADIENLTKRADYDRRIFQDGIYITSKDGKEIK